MTCEDFQARYLARDLDSETAAHVSGCAWCSSRLSDLDLISERMSEDAIWVGPSDELEDHVVAGIASQPHPLSRRFNRTWIMSAAASLLVVLVGASLLVRSRQPDWEIALPASEGIAAVASVAGWNTGAGTRMIFDIDGLDPAGDNEFYEIWLTADDGRHVSAGTFTGSGEIDSFAGVSRRDFPRIWITLEPNDGDEGINGPTVLDTKIDA